MTAENSKLFEEKKALRQNEYYDMQPIFDKLFALSKKGCNHYNLMDIITSDNNILLAYRKIKRNKGSKTKGTNDSTIEDIADMSEETFVKMVKDRLNNFHPHSVRRVEIPKPDGRTRPLGIPTIEDRIIQECIKQVIEPICEAQFYNHSYGFRPNRDTENAIARFNDLAFKGYHYVVDIDIKSFFDNVNHGKLLKQLWALGIRDKKLIKILSLMLKAEIEGEGVSNKGTPQGGILSPLLSNVCLNELDWWIASQWEKFPTRHKYQKLDKYKAMRKTMLKEIWIIRYADDFKIMCKDHKTARKIFIATKMWLKERLSLEISPEKSMITNLKKNYSSFLGFKLKVKKSKKAKMGYTNRSHVLKKAKLKARNKIKSKIRILQKEPTVENVNKYNSTVLGLQNYYSTATMVSQDFAEIAYIVNKSLKCRLHKQCSDEGKTNEAYKKFYGKYNFKKTYIAGIALFPIAAIKFCIPANFSQDITPYTVKGRETIHANLKFKTVYIMRYLMENPIKGESTEYNDNRISLFAGQQGKCYVTKDWLQIGEMEIHHKIPREKNGTDKYDNLLYVTKTVHSLIHATRPETIEFYMNKLKLDKKSLIKLNKLRSTVGNDVIVRNNIDRARYEAKVSRTVLSEGKAGNSQDTEGLPIATGRRYPISG